MDCAADHRNDTAHLDECTALRKLGCKDDWKSHLNELNTSPDRPAIREVILSPMAIEKLGGHQITQHPARIIDLSDR